MASPIVAGAASLILSINPFLRPDHVKDLLIITVTPFTSTANHLNQMGSGRINLESALLEFFSDVHVVISGIQTGSVGIDYERLNRDRTVISRENQSWGNGDQVFTNRIFYGNRYTMTISNTNQPTDHFCKFKTCNIPGLSVVGDIVPPLCTMDNNVDSESSSISGQVYGIFNPDPTIDLRVTIQCKIIYYKVGGKVSGLKGELRLQNNGGDEIAITSNGSYTFPTKIKDGAPYIVTIALQPSGQDCWRYNPKGTMPGGRDVTNVDIVCKDLLTIGGNISGYVTGLAGEGLILQNNDSDDTSISANGPFVFSTPVRSGSDYMVSIKSLPLHQKCGFIDCPGKRESGNQICRGSMGESDIRSISVECLNPYKARISKWTTDRIWGGSGYNFVGDFNDDHKLDILNAYGFNGYIKFSQGDKFADSSTVFGVTLDWGSPGYIFTGDFNADGITDIATPFGENILIKYTESDKFTEESHRITTSWGGKGYIWVADFYGDSRSDFLTTAGYKLYLKEKINNGFTEHAWDITTDIGGNYSWKGRFDSNDQYDLATASGDNVYMKLFSGNRFQEKTWTVPTNAWGGVGYNWAGDFNGDGLTDIASGLGYHVYMRASTGSGFSEDKENWYLEAPFGGPGYTWVGDFNGDGRDDLLSANGYKVYIRLSLGNGFLLETVDLDTTWNIGQQTWVGDINGDNRDDFISIDTNGDVNVLMLANP